MMYSSKYMQFEFTLKLKDTLILLRNELLGSITGKYKYNCQLFCPLIDVFMDGNTKFLRTHNTD